MPFRLEVFPSEKACGYGNVTVDGQILPQTLKGEGSNDLGAITTERNRLIFGSWSFHCIKVDGQPDAQLLKFTINSLDQERTMLNGFTALFRQTGLTEILSIGTDLSIPFEVLASPQLQGAQPAGHKDHEFSVYDIEQEMDELHWLRAKVKELKYHIWAKEQAIAKYASPHFKEDIQECHGMKCAARALVDKAVKIAHRFFDKFHGHHNEHKHEHHGKHGNHSCVSHKHRDHTAPPRWKKSHHKLLPICRYPPPPRKGHRPGNHHDAPAPAPGELLPPSPAPKPQMGFHEDEDMAPPAGPQASFFRNGPEGHHRGGSNHEMGTPHEGHHETLSNGMKSHDGTSDSPLPHEEPQGLAHDEKRPHDRIYGPPGSQKGAPFGVLSHEPPAPGLSVPSGTRHNSFGKAFHITKFVIIGILISLFVIILHRRACNASTRAERRAGRRARREHRHRRRESRRAARRHAVPRFLARISGYNFEGSDCQEKRQAQLASDAEDGMSSTMTAEITEFRNAVEVVDDMVSESSRRAQLVPTHNSSTPSVSDDRHSTRDFDIGSEARDGEELPAYDDSEGSQVSNAVADGFQYTPGSTEYSSSHSIAGSLSDILGRDTK